MLRMHYESPPLYQHLQKKGWVIKKKRDGTRKMSEKKRYVKTKISNTHGKHSMGREKRELKWAGPQ